MTEFIQPEEKIIINYLTAALSEPLEIFSDLADDEQHEYDLENRQTEGVLKVLEALGLDLPTLAALNQQTVMLFPVEHLEHYKGDHYIKLGEGIHTETEEAEVVYYRPSDRRWFVRPSAMFKEVITVADQLRGRFIAKPMGRLLKDLF